jgi:hypothetical protein
MAFRIAFMMIAVSAVMLLVLSPGTAEYVVSVLTLILGLVFAGLVAVLVRVL